MGETWPLTGRGKELSVVRAALARRDRVRGVVLAGAPGVGRTRLARAALLAAAGRGAVTRWVPATASAGALPLGAFTSVLGPAGPDLDLCAAVEALRGAAGPHRLVLGIDDAHLLDDVSAHLVHHLVLRGAATVVATVCAGEPAPDAITALWKDGHLDRLDLEPLSVADTTELLEAVLGAPVESASARRIWTCTRGNPLYLRRLVECARQQATLHRSGGLWRWSGRPALSTELARLVQARMGVVTDRCGDVLDVLAFAEPLAVDALAALTDPAAVEEAETRGLITVEPDGSGLRARPAHPLFAAVRRAQTGVLRGRRIQARIATALLAGGVHHPDDTVRIATLVVDAGLPPDTPLLTTAACRAMELFDLPVAARLARAAVAAGGGFEAQRVLTTALFWLGDPEVATAVAVLTEQADTDELRARAAVLNAAALFWTLRRPDAALAVLDDLDAAVTDPLARHTALAMRAAMLGCLGRPLEAVRAASAALAEPRLPAHAVLLASWGIVLGLGVLGRADELGAVAARAGAVAGSVDVSFLRLTLADARLVGLRLAGRLHEAEQVARAQQTVDDDLCAPAHAAVVGLLGLAALGRGRLRTAHRLLLEARAGVERVVTAGQFRCLIGLVQAAAAVGDGAGAAAALAEVEANDRPGFAFLAPEVLLARAWAAAAHGALTQARALAHAAADAAHAQPGFAVLALHTAVCFGDGAAADRLAALATRVDGPRASGAAGHAAALADRDGDRLDEISRRFEETGDRLAALDAAAHAAAAHEAVGHRGAATASAARATRLAAECEGARTPALQAVDNPLPLTGREREIVTLAALGLSNRNIAERLTLSVRTVEGHVYRAGIKLGIPHRHGLVVVLDDHREIATAG